MKILDSIAIIICFVALFFYFNKNSSDLTKINSFEHSIKECQKAINSQECSILSIRKQIELSSLTYTAQNVLWNTNDELIDALTGENLFLNTQNLNNYQKNIWYAYINEKKFIKTSEENKMVKHDIFTYGIIILILIILLIISIPIINFLWKFLLNRISDISNAFKGKKF